jgi:hypothetical protein
MNLFQVIALSVLLVLLATSVLAVSKKWTTRGSGFAWAALWILAGVVVAKPDLTFKLAGPLGIHRGADLVVYCALLGMMVGFFMVYARLRRLRHDVTALTRHLAIRDAHVTPDRRLEL